MPGCGFQIPGLRWGQRGVHENEVAGIPWSRCGWGEVRGPNDGQLVSGQQQI